MDILNLILIVFALAGAFVTAILFGVVVWIVLGRLNDE